GVRLNYFYVAVNSNLYVFDMDTATWQDPIPLSVTAVPLSGLTLVNDMSQGRELEYLISTTTIYGIS
ncbi:MAG: hypothetical protein WC284_14800, partial [Candidimonas sp.]